MRDKSGRYFEGVGIIYPLSQKNRPSIAQSDFCREGYEGFMYQNDEYPNISKLSPSAAKLLLSYLYNGMEGKPIERMMHSGIMREQTFFAAEVELAQAGFIERDAGRGKGTRLLSIVYPPIHPSLQSAETNCTCTPHSEAVTLDRVTSKVKYIKYIVMGLGNGSTGENDIKAPTESVGSFEESTNRKCWYSEKAPTEAVGSSKKEPTESVGTSTPLLKAPTESVGALGELPTESVGSESIHTTETVGALVDRCVEVDGIEGKGKRTAQLPLVDEIWEHFFPKAHPLIAENKKFFLRCTGNSLEILHDELEYIAEQDKKKGGIESLLQYAKVVLKKRGEERSKLSPSLQSAPVQVPVLVGASAYREGEPLPPPDPAWLKQSRDEGAEFMKKFIEERGLLE